MKRAFVWRRCVPMALLAAGVTLITWSAGDQAAAAVESDEQIAVRKQAVAQIDRRIAEGWSRAAIEPSAAADDAEFVRRAYLDLTGVIPRVSEVREFLHDSAPDKRARLVDRLLESPRHATHLANQWRNILLPGGTTPENLNSAAGVQNWMRAQFAENLRYDRLVADFLVVNSGNETGPALFYTTLELKPEKLAAATARIFLGLQIECAQCHHHPFDKWRQEEFWGYAAFFAQLRQPTMNAPAAQISIEDLPMGEVQLPGTSTVVSPAFPDGKKPRTDESGTRREQLAIWMASRDNPYLARAAVNRAWAHLFGRGLVEPVDDIGPHNPPSHPELMDELTAYFVASGFDLRELYRTLSQTRAYQLSSVQTATPTPPELFARMELKPLSADQMLDSFERLRLASRSTSAGAMLNTPLADPRRQMFLVKFPPPGRSATDYQSGVLQALTMLNGEYTASLTRASDGGIVAAVDSPLFDAEERVRILFLATLARYPEADELERFATHLRQGPPAPQSLEDLLWALMNSAEFTFNH